MSAESEKKKMGRPRVEKSGELLYKYTVRLSDSQAKKAINKGKGNLSEGIREFIDACQVDNSKKE